MTKLTRNLIIAGSSTAAAGGVAAGVAVAVVKKNEADHNKAMLDKTAEVAASIYNESHQHEIDVYIASQISKWNEETQRNTEIATQAASTNSFGEATLADKEFDERKASFEHFRENVVRDYWAEVASENILEAKNSSEDKVLLERQRVKYEVARFAKAEYEGCQNSVWRAAHKDLIINFEDSYPMTVLARDWWYLLQAESVAQIKHLEKEMIFQIEKQYGVVVEKLGDL